HRHVHSFPTRRSSDLKALFERLVVNPPGADGSRPGLPPGAKDPLILAWSHVYLGRIHDVDGNRELAVSEYRAALAVEGAPESARSEEHTSELQSRENL